jgi:predicted translin family RNA/ssDNA-binding protein
VPVIREILRRNGYAIASAHRRPMLQASRIVDPAIRRFVALAMSPHRELTLACKTVMQEIVAIARAGAEVMSRRVV